MILDSELWIHRNEVSDEIFDAIADVLSIPNKSFGRFSKALGKKDFRKFLIYYRLEGDYVAVPRNLGRAFFSLDEIRTDTTMSKRTKNQEDIFVENLDKIDARFPKLNLIDETSAGHDIDIEFSASLRESQKKFLSRETFADREKNKDVIMVAPCGSGKTTMGLQQICQIAKSTIILVPTEFLQKQFFARLQEHADSSRINVYMSNPKDFDKKWRDADILIMTYDLLVSRQMPKEFYDNWGHLVIDEGHRVGSECYERVVPSINSEYRTLLTATMRRSDLMAPIVRFHFGAQESMPDDKPKVRVIPKWTGIPLNYLVSANESVQTYVNDICEALGQVEEIGDYYHFPNCTDDDIAGLIHCLPELGATREEMKELKKALTSGLNALKGDYNYAAMDTYFSMHPRKLRYVKTLVKEMYNKGRNILVLGKRVEALKILHKYFVEEYGEKEVEIVLGKNHRSKSIEEYDFSGVRILLGIDKLAKEGLDVPHLDLLISMTPIKDTEQMLGRVARIYPNKPEPVCLYLIDNHLSQEAIFRKAKSTYIHINGYIPKDSNLSKNESEQKKAARASGKTAWRKRRISPRTT